MLVLICFIAAVVCWLLGALNVAWPATKPINWLCAGLMFAGLGLWIVGHLG
jgi:hypothetical protein